MAEDKASIFNQPGKLTPEEIHEIGLDNLPATARRRARGTLDRLEESMKGSLVAYGVQGEKNTLKPKSRISAKSGGSHVKDLDPINYTNEEKGVPTSEMTQSDINPASKSEN